MKKGSLLLVVVLVLSVAASWSSSGEPQEMQSDAKPPFVHEKGSAAQESSQRPKENVSPPNKTANPSSPSPQKTIRLKDFTPSENIAAENAVDFPADI